VDLVECGHLLCELIGGPCSLMTGRSRGCTPGLGPRTIAPEVFDEVRTLVAVIETRGSARQDIEPAAANERIKAAAIRLAEIIRREARDDRNLVTHARNEEPELAPILETLCLRHRP
jgi:hypothetical protein